ncbi:MAG: dephospho-CoA kinase [Planctomycetota bacterium]|jgi:dephospho-CoA kinase
MANEKTIIGILGGICSGKSTVARQFGQLGCGVVDADAIAHELLENDDIKKEIKKAFGQAVFDSNGQIKKEELAARAFVDDDSVAKINEIIHPPVLARCRELIAGFNRQDDIKAVVLDIPLLAEAGWVKKCDKVVFVECQGQIRASRAAEKRGFSKKQLKKRENFQIFLDKKKKIADYTVDNNSGLSATAGQVARIFTIIIGEKQDLT